MFAKHVCKPELSFDLGENLGEDEVGYEVEARAGEFQVGKETFQNLSTSSLCDPGDEQTGCSRPELPLVRRVPAIP